MALAKHCRLWLKPDLHVLYPPHKWDGNEFEPIFRPCWCCHHRCSEGRKSGGYVRFPPYGRVQRGVYEIGIGVNNPYPPLRRQPHPSPRKESPALVVVVTNKSKVFHLLPVLPPKKPYLYSISTSSVKAWPVQVRIQPLARSSSVSTSFLAISTLPVLQKAIHAEQMPLRQL